MLNKLICVCLLLGTLILSATTSHNRSGQGGVVLIGGGEFPKESIKWAADHSSGGYFSVIGCYSANESKWKKRLEGYDFQLIVLGSREDASNPCNLQIVRDSAVIFLDGGNQYDYVTLIGGTPLNAVVNECIKRGTPIGGTSAGMAVLSEYYFSAKYDTVSSEEVGGNPKHPAIDIGRSLFDVPILRNFMVDTHYSQRKRMGRLSTFLQRVVEDFKVKVVGVGVDEGTALCIDATGNKTVFGNGKAHYVNVEMVVSK